MKGWVGLVGWRLSGWFTHISGHPWDRESSPVRDRRSTTVLRHQLSDACTISYIRAQLLPHSFPSHATPQSPIYWTAKKRARSLACPCHWHTNTLALAQFPVTACGSHCMHARTLALRPAFTTRPLPRFPRNYWSRMRCRKTGPFNFPAENSYILTIHKSVRQIQLYTNNHTKLQQYWQLLPPTE